MSGRGFSAVGGASQLGLVHAAHQLLQLDGQRHVPLNPQLPRHEGHGGLQLPWNETAVTMETTATTVDGGRRLTCKHLGEVTGVHRHDDVSFDGGFALTGAAGAALQVQKPDAAVFS